MDTRSDTVTVPTRAMREAMLDAPVGDDVMIEDPSVNALESKVADLCGKESALFVATGVMSNQVCIISHLAHNPDSPTVFQSILADSRSHIHLYENGGVAANSRAHTVPVTPSNGLYLTAEDVEKNLQRTLDWHQPVTTLVCLEVPINGVLTPIDELHRIRAVCDKHKYVRMHLDGARAWNASISLSVSMADLCGPFDSVSLCLSKGLGAPVGSVLVGGKSFVHRGREIRKSLGGGWRQAGMLAAAASYAIDNHFGEMMERTHALAKRLEKGLSALNVTIDLPVESSMVWATAESDKCGFDSWAPIARRLKEKHSVNIGEQEPGESTVRFVMHIQCSEEGVDAIIAETKAEIEKK